MTTDQIRCYFGKMQRTSYSFIILKHDCVNLDYVGAIDAKKFQLYFFFFFFWGGGGGRGRQAVESKRVCETCTFLLQVSPLYEWDECLNCGVNLLLYCTMKLIGNGRLYMFALREMFTGIQQFIFNHKINRYCRMFYHQGTWYTLTL